MSYCRWIEADIYLFETLGGAIECCGCPLAEEGIETDGASVLVRFHRRSDTLSHVKAHRQAGHNVPDHVDERLLAEIKAQGDLL